MCLRLQGNVKVINSRETVPKVFRPDLLAACPKTFQLVAGTGLCIINRLYHTVGQKHTQESG